MREFGRGGEQNRVENPGVMAFSLLGQIKMCLALGIYVSLNQDCKCPSLIFRDIFCTLVYNLQCNMTMENDALSSEMIF